MREFAVSEAEQQFGTLLDLVEAGEDVVITRDGKAIARLVSEVADRDIDKARAAAERIRRTRNSVRLGGLKIRDLIDEGRL